MTGKTVGVCGAGLMGSGIAQVFARAGCDVVLHDVAPEMLERATRGIGERLQREVDKGRLDAQAAAEAAARVHATQTLADLAPATFVVEAVVESIAVKREVFAALDRVCPPEAILVTNTSTLSVTEVGAATQRAAQTAGMHFFNPAPMMPLVEITAGIETSPATLAAVREMASAIGKTPVSLQDSPGGIVSRLQILVRNEAAFMVAEGIATAEDIDTAMRLGAGWPMGPLALADLVGIDLHVTNSDSLCRELGTERFRPAPLLRKMVRAGWLGRKSGRGFFPYQGGKAT